MALTDIVIMPSADYKSICESVRRKTGKTVALKSGEIAPLIDTITGEIDNQECTVDITLPDYVCMPSTDYVAICESVRTKTSYEGVLKSGKIAPLIYGIAQEVDVTDFLPLTLVNVAYSESDGAYVSQSVAQNFSLVEGEKYIVEWDGIEYECEYIEHEVKINTLNATTTGLGDVFNMKKVWGVTLLYPNSVSTGEPFYIYISDRNYSVVTQSTKSTHTLRIYQPN